jgi:PAS domain S-box-containing protein
LGLAFRDHASYGLGVAAVVTALILAIVFQPVYAFMRRWVDKRFYREDYNYRQALMRASEKMGAMLNIGELSEWLVENFKETTHASKAGLFLLDPGTQRYVPKVLMGYDNFSVDKVRLRSDNPVIKYLARENGCLTAEDIDRLPKLRSLWNAERGQLKQLEAAVLVPLKVKGELIGVVMLGPKRSEQAYTLDDLELLLTVASQAAVAIENAQLFETSLMRAERLKESEEKYRDLVEHMQDAYIVLRGDRIVFANRRCSEELGIPLDQIKGQPFLKFLSPESLELAMQLYERSMGGESVTGERHEFTILREDGMRIPTEVSFRDIIYEGKPAVSHILRDITERKRAEEELKESEELSRGMLESAATGIYLVQEGKFQYVSPLFEEISGYTSDELVGTYSLGYVHPEDREVVREKVIESLKGRSSSPYEFRFMRKDGEPIWILEKVASIQYRGEPATLGSFMDITERKRAEAELKKRRDELEQRTNQLLALQKVSTSIQSTLELREVLQQVSEAVVTNLGWDHSLLFLSDEKGNVARGTVFFTKLGAELVSDVERVIAQALTQLEVPMVKGYSRVVDESLDGKTTIAHHIYEIGEPPLTREECDAAQEVTRAKTVVNVPAFTKDRAVGSIMVFTEREEVTEAELEPLSILANQMGIAIENATLYRDATERAQRLAVTSEISRILGSSLDIRDVYQAFTDEIRKIINFDRASIALAEGEQLRFFAVSTEVPTELGDGVTIPLEESVTAWVMENKRTNIETDFTQEAQFLINGKHLKSGLRSAIRIPLFSKGEVFGTFNLTSRYPNAYGERERDILEQVAGQLAVAVENSQLFIKIREREMELSKAYEELKAAQDFMVQSERLRALGEMAGGVAHDFNNILSVILGRAQLALEDTEEPGVKRALQIIEQTAVDASKTVRRLQDFARVRVDRDIEMVDLNQVVESALQMVESRRQERGELEGVPIDISIELDNVAPIEGNPAELREALVNILFNAMDAMPEGGKITIKSELKNHWVVLFVSDTGVGIPEEIKGRIFDPFFTTKGPEGLGWDSV